MKKYDRLPDYGLTDWTPVHKESVLRTNMNVCEVIKNRLSHVNKDGSIGVRFFRD